MQWVVLYFSSWFSDWIGMKRQVLLQKFNNTHLHMGSAGDRSSTKAI